ncbi:tRNA (adenosine(37)-N6)-dimethylallyltransferase MiaA [Microbacterium esteraromaticum]|uniref:tRNA (adenosine(37)-N6)-dimethylallyltransferase MiaA n=1 Tax=Microbacterium esteraromaticum TaxID=57043 RepID=UPI0032424E03
MRSPRVWAVVGATGTGKSEFALELAEALRQQGNPAEIVNVDAMQLYRGMDIGTAKLSPAERRGIPHHLFDVRDVTEEAAVAWYQPLARAAVADIHSRCGDAILVGGSGLYVSSVIFDFRFPPRDPAVRARLESELAERGPGVLLERLTQRDPAAAARIDPKNPRRIVRALEVLEQGGQTHGAALPERPELWHPHTRIIGLHAPREVLVERLDRRVERMWRDGMLQEVEALRERGLERGATAARAIGYAQALAQVRGDKSEADAIAETQALTRRYARRQVSWFKRYPDIEWLESGTSGGAVLR